MIMIHHQEQCAYYGDGNNFPVKAKFGAEEFFHLAIQQSKVLISVREIRLIAIRAEQCGNFIRITVKLKAPVREE